MSGLFWEREDARRSSVLPNEAALETIASALSVSELQIEDAKKQQHEAPGVAAGIGTTPSADPELWAAIMASLEEQSKQRGRQLSRHLSDVAPDVAGRLRQQRSESVRCSAEGVTFFPAVDPAEGGGDCGLVLPSFGGYSPSVRAAVLGQLCNSYLQNEAEQEGVINAVPGCTPQLVLATLGDGNCLSHACSLGVWGIHDRDSRLRAAIAQTMAHPAAGAQVRQRFERQLEANGIPAEAWAAEWERELASLADSSTYLSDVHCYVLANVLRRPILIYSDETAAAAGLSGVYLPSLWSEHPEQCSRQPLSVLFGWSHFSLLLTIQGEGPASPPLLPLAIRGGPLLPRFLSAAEQALLDQAASAAGGGGGSGSNLSSSGGGSSAAGIAGSGKAGGKAGGGGSKASSKDPELELLGRYMDAVRLYDGRLGVRLSEAPRPHVLVALLGSVYVRQVHQEQQQQEEQEQTGSYTCGPPTAA